MLPLGAARGVSLIDRLLGSSVSLGPVGEEPSPSQRRRSGAPRQVPPPPQFPRHLPARRPDDRQHLQLRSVARRRCRDIRAAGIYLERGGSLHYPFTCQREGTRQHDRGGHSDQSRIWKCLVVLSIFYNKLDVHTILCLVFVVYVIIVRRPQPSPASILCSVMPPSHSRGFRCTLESNVQFAVDV